MQHDNATALNHPGVWKGHPTGLTRAHVRQQSVYGDVLELDSARSAKSCGARAI